MVRRQLILEAAARLYAEQGYRGATTRRIAAAAGVSEVTIFLLFGTKEALIQQALIDVSIPMPMSRALPHRPSNPERELVRWCGAYIRRLRQSRHLIRNSLGELADRPSLAANVGNLTAAASRMLREYLERATHHRVLPSTFDATAAATVLAGVLFADSMARDIIPDEFPSPASHAHKAYVRLILDGIYHTTCVPGGPWSPEGAHPVKPAATPRVAGRGSRRSVGPAIAKRDRSAARTS